MDAGKTVVATSVFSAVLVLGVVVPLGYLGMQTLDRKLETSRAEVRSVIIELKAETLKEIKVVAEETTKDLVEKVLAQSGGMQNAGGADPAVVASLETLEKSVAALRQGQRQLFETVKSAPAPVVAAAPVVPPGSRDDTLNQTVYFQLGKINGPITAQQVSAALPQIAEYSAGKTCRSNVMGFSDTLGGDKSNLELSEKRAKHVAALLRAKQVPVGEVRGWGERWLKVLTVDGIKNQQNRRVVVETVCEDKAEKRTGVTS